MNKGKTINNTIMLYIVTIVKLILPLITLPYLTRILSKESYGFVSYVKSSMVYMQLIIDFGFILSSVKDIVKVQSDKESISGIIGNTFIAKTLLIAIALIVITIMIYTVPVLQIDKTFVILSFLSVALTAYLADFFFRGIEKMQYITIIFLISKAISTILTFVLVKNDQTILWIPILDIIAHIVSVVFSTVFIFKLGYRIKVTKFEDAILMIKDSFTYFLSSIATTAFSALNTMLVGIIILDLAEVARWTLCLSITSAIQGLYAPICNSIYPHMIETKNLKFIHKTMLIFMPIVAIGCVFAFIFAEFGLNVAGGAEYVSSSNIFRALIPVLFFSFPAQVYGWPTLGAIGKVKETTATTIIAAIIQVVGLFFLIIVNKFTLINLAILRSLTECILMLLRLLLTYKNKYLFNRIDEIDKYGVKDKH